MGKRNFIFRGGSRELVLPVTPESYRVETGIAVEVVNIHQLGDVVLTGHGTLCTVKLSCLFPAQAYPFTRGDDPDRYVTQFKSWAKKGSKLRFIVGGTGVNLPVVVQSFGYGERDGSNDIYADIVLREYKAMKAVRVAGKAASKPREPMVESSSARVKNYTIRAGDTLSAICRREYGDGSAAVYQKLAACNKLGNPNLIYAGNVLELPHPLT